MKDMSAPIAECRLTLDGSPGLATNCFFVGNGNRADVVWSRDDFETLCGRMHNGNSPNDFLMVYRKDTGKPIFGKAHRVDVSKRADWAWNTVTGQAKSKTGIGFYPRDKNGQTSWGALDFDAHEGDRMRARELAMNAFALLVRHPTLWLILGTSGAGGGWHLFVFSELLHPCEEWARLLREVAEKIGAPIKKGVLEIFPSDSRGAYAIRAPGTWNPKDDSFGLVAYDSATPRLNAICLPKEERVSLGVRSTTSQGVASLPIGEKRAGNCGVYRGEFGAWATDFAITAPRTRHEKLAKLVGAAFFQTCKKVGGINAEMQHAEADPAPATPLSEHLSEFEGLWTGLHDKWRAKLSPREREKLDALTTDNEREAFRILRNWSQTDTPDFKAHWGSLAQRLGISLQGASKLRVRFCCLGIMRQTAPYVPHKLTARYQWRA